MCKSDRAECQKRDVHARFWTRGWVYFAPIPRMNFFVQKISFKKKNFGGSLKKAFHINPQLCLRRCHLLWVCHAQILAYPARPRFRRSLLWNQRLFNELYNDLYRFTMSCPLGDLLPCCVPRAEHWLTLLPPFSMCVYCFGVPPGQLPIVYSTAQPCWASLCREQSIAVLHVVWFCTCPLSSTGADVVVSGSPSPPKPKKKKKSTAPCNAALDALTRCLVFAPLPHPGAS